MKEELEKVSAESQHHLEQWKLAAANLENYRKRARREQGDALQLGQAALTAQLLPVLDDLERALETLSDDLRSLTWIDGLVLIERKLQMVLRQHGLKEIDALGKPYDPALHQSILQEASAEHPDGQVLAVLQKGYTFHGRVLRPALVKIAHNERKGQEPASDDKRGSEQENVQSARGEGQAPDVPEQPPDEERQ